MFLSRRMRIGLRVFAIVSQKGCDYLDYFTVESPFDDNGRIREDQLSQISILYECGPLCHCHSEVCVNRYVMLDESFYSV